MRRDLTLMLILVLTFTGGTCALAQTTVQYDSGNVGNLPSFPAGCCYGNYFTGLGASQTISKVTFYVKNNTAGINIVHIKETLMAPDAVFSPLVSAGDGFKVLTLATPFVFSGTEVHVGLNAYYSNGVALDTVSNGLGFHAYGAQATPTAITYGGNPANYVLRITGPTGLPVELTTFEIE